MHSTVTLVSQLANDNGLPKGGGDNGVSIRSLRRFEINFGLEVFSNGADNLTPGVM
jgi:hypothetical protein